MKNKNLLLFGAAALGLFVIYKIAIKPRIVKKAATKAIEDYTTQVGLPETMANPLEFTEYKEV
jgi:hypothetical protein